MTGIFNYSLIVVSGYVLIVYGFTLVYSSFGGEDRASLFAGTALFLLGIIFFLTGFVDFPVPVRMIIPAFMFITGIGFLILFLDDSYNIILLILSASFIILGLAATVLWGSISVSSFIRNIGVITLRYWPVILISAGIIYLSKRLK
jgi:hypothetical protein